MWGEGGVVAWLATSPYKCISVVVSNETKGFFALSFFFHRMRNFVGVAAGHTTFLRTVNFDAKKLPLIIFLSKHHPC